jgi:hypothetical protein
VTKDEALKLALHGLEMGVTLIEDFGSKEQLNTQHKAIAAIYEALAQPEPCGGCKGSGWVTRDPDIGTDQECFVCGGSGAYPKEPEQEPVVCDCDSPSWCKQYKKCNRKMLGFMPYVAQPQRTWVGLTDEDDLDWEEGGNLKDLVKAIEAKLKEKNT